MKRQLLFLTATLAACAGCDLSFRSDSGNTGGRSSPFVQVETAPEAAAQPGQPAPSDGPAQPAASPPAAQTTLQPAEAGVGAKGSGYGGGLVTEPIRVRFRAEERIRFDQVKHALQLFEASEGRAPASHEEFMERIIQANGIELPELPPGQRYVYDPQTKQLMVEAPQP